VKLLTAITLLVLVFIFQNCGDSARVSLVTAERYNSSLNQDCNGLECVNPEELLWIKIREYEPYKIHHPTFLEVGHFTIGGQCGTGLFENHTFLWEIREGFGAQAVVGRGFSDNRCYLGQFQIPVAANIINGNPIRANQRYQLRVELVGVGSSNEQFTNPMPTNKSSLDILFLQTL